jgi:hypothetical protein
MLASEEGIITEGILSYLRYLEPPYERESGTTRLSVLESDSRFSAFWEDVFMRTIFCVVPSECSLEKSPSLS